LGETDAVLAGDLADERGGAGFFVLFMSGGCCDRRRCGNSFLFFGLLSFRFVAGFSGAGAGFAAASPSTAMVPTTVFTFTVVPSATLISWRTPEAGAGISASTLSVEISKRGSSRWTLSPGFFSHLVIVPSTMDSPIWGMMMSVGMSSFL
jgi:hypothetical protein